MKIHWGRLGFAVLIGLAGCLLTEATTWWPLPLWAAVAYCVLSFGAE